MEGLPDEIGSFIYYEDTLIFSAADDVLVMNSDNEIVKTTSIVIEEDGTSKSMYHEKLRWQIITRSEHYYLRVWDTENPAVHQFKGFERYDLSADFIFKAEFTYYDPPKKFDVLTELGGRQRDGFCWQGNLHVPQQNAQS